MSDILKEHGTILPTDVYPYDSNGRGIHGIAGINPVSNESEREALIQQSDDHTRVIVQTGGTNPGVYIANGAGEWLYIGGWNSVAGSKNLLSLSASIATVADVNLYVDNINGDDSNDGSVGNPLKTLVEAESRLPLVIDHRVVIRVLPYDASVPNVGSYVWPTFRSRIFREKVIIAGTEYETIASGIAQIGSDQLHVVTTGGMTPDEHVTNLRYIKMTSGSADGDIRLISENTATDIDPAYPFSGTVGSGDTYDIVQPLIKFDVPSIGGRCVLAQGVQLGFGSVYDGTPLSGLYIVNMNMNFAEPWVASDNVTVLFFTVKVSSPEPTYFKSNAGILAGVEEITTALPDMRSSTLLASIPELCPTISALGGSGLAVSGSLYLHTFLVGFDGFVVSTGNVGASLPFFDQIARHSPNAAIRGGRCTGIYIGNSSAWDSGHFKVTTARVDSNPHIDFKVRANTSLPAVQARYSNLVLMQCDITNVGSGPAVVAEGIDSKIAIYYSNGSSTSGVGVIAQKGGKIRVDGSSTFSGASGADFSEDGGVTTRPWSSLVADSWFIDTVRGSVVCRP